ncbi:MAG: hypothetical protein RL141_1108 [Candidatus Parcubacteria bacterium]|jgi:hypothetical protein
MKRTLFFFLAIPLLAIPAITHAAPMIGSVMPITATAGTPVNLSATVSSGTPIASCTLWVDLAEIGSMTVSGGTASRLYTFPNGGSRIAFVFCRDTSGGMSAGATTAITVSGAIQTQAPLSVPSQTASPATPASPATTSVPVSTAPVTSTVTSTAPTGTTTAAHAGQLLKAVCPAASDIAHPCRSVYYIGKDGKRHAFPNSRVFFTWYGGFESVKEVSTETLSGYPLGANVLYRAGVRMVKFTTDPKVYAVSRGGTLRWITTESLARAYYGDTWNKKIDDMPDSFYVNYSFGEAIDAAEDYNPKMELDHSTE